MQVATPTNGGKRAPRQVTTRALPPQMTAEPRRGSKRVPDARNACRTLQTRTGRLKRVPDTSDAYRTPQTRTGHLRRVPDTPPRAGHRGPDARAGHRAKRPDTGRKGVLDAPRGALMNRRQQKKRRKSWCPPKPSRPCPWEGAFAGRGSPTAQMPRDCPCPREPLWARKPWPPRRSSRRNKPR